MVFSFSFCCESSHFSRTKRPAFLVSLFCWAFWEIEIPIGVLLYLDVHSCLNRRRFWGVSVSGLLLNYICFSVDGHVQQEQPTSTNQAAAIDVSYDLVLLSAPSL